MERKNAIVEILFKHNVLTEPRYQKVEEEIEKTGLSFIAALDKLGLIKEEEVVQLISVETGVSFVDVANYIINDDLIKIIPERLARKYKLIPIFRVGDKLTIAMVNPKDLMALDEVRHVTGIEHIDVVLSTETSIVKIIEDVYKHIEGTRIGDIVNEIHKDADLKGPSVIEIVDLIVDHAVKRRSSDIHLEPTKDAFRVRYRIDGILHEANSFPKVLQNAIVARIKLISEMDIAESRFPQDGKVNMKVEDKNYDIRVSSFPTMYGENIVMRLLDKSSIVMGLNQLGFLGDDFHTVEKLIKAPFGMVLVTGPTGSGKTTTLYAILSAINSMDKNIITLEDPIEYELPLIRQTQVNPKAGLTFANELRAVLRQDPDIIMVGEIRDVETAEVSVRAALTGHFVLSTLHTNDAPSALTRLIDMGIEPFLVSSTVIAILAQRLVRLVCDKCKHPYVPEGIDLKEIGSYGIEQFFKGKGCSQCNNTGFLGRIGIFELLVVNDEIKKKIISRSSSEELLALALKNNMKTLFYDGIEKVKRGITTIEEVLRVTKEL